MNDYHAVQVQGSPQLKEAVDREEVAISAAARVARQQLPDQKTEGLERVRSGAASTLPQAALRGKSKFCGRNPPGQQSLAPLAPWPPHNWEFHNVRS